MFTLSGRALSVLPTYEIQIDGPSFLVGLCAGVVLLFVVLLLMGASGTDPDKWNGGSHE